MTSLDRLAAMLSNLGDLRTDEPLLRHTTFGVGGPADLFLTVRSSQSLGAAAAMAHDAEVDTFVLGSGSNILVADAGMRGLVIDNRSRKEEVAEGRTIRVDSGCSLAGYARRMCRAGLDGMTWAVGIPGTIGGAVVYNAGAYGGCMGDVLKRVRLQDPGGEAQWVEASALGLVYRGSMFTRGQFAGKTVLEAEVQLVEGDAKELLQRAASYDAKRLGAQPRGRNAGSMFKNPAEHPAWRLIDAVGLRGASRGEAAISDKHCNFFVNNGTAQATDVAWLVSEAERRVQDQFGVTLEREVAFVGAW